jgi:hypothetical protein
MHTRISVCVGCYGECWCALLVNLSRTSEHFLRARRHSAAPSLARAYVTCAGGLMQMQHTTTAQVPSFSLGRHSSRSSLSHSLLAVFACLWSVVNSLSSLPNSRRDRLAATREKTPLQGSRFADLSAIHHQSSTGRQQPPRVISTNRPVTMANLFRRIYDWLLRLFWYAYLASSYLCRALALMPDALFDISNPHQQQPKEKAKSSTTMIRDGC